MKLNQVLPLFGIFGTIGIVTPFITSCSKYTFTYNNSQLNVKDLQLKTKQLTTPPESGKETDYYFEHINKNHQILADDIANTIHNQCWEEGKYSDINLDINLVDNPNINKHLLSLKITFNLVEKETNNSYTNIFTIKNMEMQANKEDSIWYITPKFLLLENDEEKISLLNNNDATASWKNTEEIGVTTSSYEMILNKDTRSQEYLSNWLNIYSNLDLVSWYFAKI